MTYTAGGRPRSDGRVVYELTGLGRVWLGHCQPVPPDVEDDDPASLVISTEERKEAAQ